MTVLPIVERELRVAARRRSTYWARVVAALGTMLIGLWVVSFSGATALPAQAGARVFAALAYIAFFGCLLGGIFLTADSLSREKREGTLGLLFLTDLKGYDVVLGKLLAASLNTFYGLLAMLPLLALPLVIGGVTPSQFCRAMGVLVNTLFFSLAAGMCLSAVSRRELSAMLGAGGLVLAVVSLPLAFGGLTKLLSPLGAMIAALNGGSSLVQLAGALLIVQAGAWLLLLAASRTVPRTWQDELMERQQAAAKEAGPAVRTRSSAELDDLNLNPITWLASRGRGRAWMSASLALLPLAAILVKIGSAEAFCLSLLLKTAVVFAVALAAARRLHEDRRTGALETIASTPLSVREILDGQLLSLKRQFSGPVAALLLFDALVGLAGGAAPRGAPFLFMVAASAGVFVLNLHALAALSLWFGLNCKASWRAALASVGIVWIAPAALALMILLLSSAVAVAGGITLFALLWLMLSAVAAAMARRDARDQLEARFRELATTPPGNIPPESEWVGSELDEDYALVP